MSPPIIPFKETITFASKQDKSKNEEKQATFEQKQQEQLSPTTTQKEQNFTIGPDGRVEIQSSDKRITMCVRAKSLPDAVTKFLESNVQYIKLLNKFNQNKISTDLQDTLKLLNEFKADLIKEFEQSTKDVSDKQDWQNVVNNILAFGPNRYGPNILVNKVDNIRSVWSILDGANAQEKSNRVSALKEYENNILFGFNLTASKGPICEEPMQGVCFFIEKFQEDQSRAKEEAGLEKELEKLDLAEDEETDKTEKKFKMQSVTSQCISLTKEACRRAFEAQPQRLMAAMYKCEILTVNSEALGKLYAVLGKRNARIIDESIKDSTNMFCITSYLPVADSFGLAEEIRKRTSGLATPHIEFSHFEIIDIDPYWEPKTEEELEAYGKEIWMHYFAF